MRKLSTPNSFSRKTAMSFNIFSFFYFFMFLSVIALSIVILNAFFYKKAYPWDMVFFVISVILIFLVKFQSKFLLPLIIISFSTLVSLYDNDLFEVLLYEEPKSENIAKIKERTMVLIQICLLMTNNLTINLACFIINFSLLIALKYNSFQNSNGSINPKELFYFLCYLAFYVFIMIRFKILYQSEDLIMKTLESSKEFSGFFKKYIKKYSKTPMVILSLEPREGKQPNSTTPPKQKILRSSFGSPPKIQTKASIINDLNCIGRQYFLSIIFNNDEFKELFQVETNEDLDKIFKEMIVFTEKIERTDGSNIKEKIGDLREECFKIFNKLKILSLSKGALPDNIIFDTEYKFNNSVENSHFLVHSFPIIYKDKVNLMLVFHDISEKLEIQRLKALDAYKDSIMANVTHDLRSPLQGFLACLEMFELKCTNEQEVLMMQIARSNVQMMGSLIQDILDDSQIKMGKIKLNLKEFNTKDFANEIVNFIKVLAKEHGVFINSIISQYIPDTIYSDNIRLKQVLVNLMNNSLKFTPTNGTITLEVAVQPKKPKYLYFCVKDTGNGIPQDIIDKLFKPYSTFQGKNGINKQGIGLGLTICQNIVALLGPYNRILCHSELGKGTKFSFYIYTDKAQFETNFNFHKMRSSMDDSINDKFDNENLLNYNLYSEFKISSNLNSENSKLIKTEEEAGSINEELDEYIDPANSKRPLNLDSDFVISSPTSAQNKRLFNKLVEIDLKSFTLNHCIKSCSLGSPELNFPKSKRNEISPPILRKSLRKQLKGNIGSFKPRTFESIPNYSSFRNKRGYSVNKKSPKNKTSIFVKDLFLNSKVDSWNNKHVKFSGDWEIKQIVIVDDDQTCLWALEMMVKKMFEVVEIKKFQSGEQAFEYYTTSKTPIDLIFTDITMPGLSGDQLSKKIKENNQNIVIIGVSGYEPTEELLKTFDDVLTKPITEVTLRESITRVFGKKQ